MSESEITTTLSVKDLSELLRLVFERNGCSEQVASVLAENCTSAERDGALSHGLMRVPGYVQTLKSGWVDGHAIPALEDVAPSLIRVDARNGFAQPALAIARKELISKAKTNGVALLAIRNSHHFAALSFDVEPFAEDGLIALSVLNSLTTVVPHGAKTPVFGTNPIAFAAPRAGGAPIVFDMATSFLAKGDVRIAARDGHLLPVGAGIDKHGQPTIDPNAVLDGGALMPFGGHKGSALAMMVEILCAALVGGDFSFEVDWSAYPGAQTPRTGQTVIVIDPSTGASGLRNFASRVELLTEVLRSAGQERMPGDRRQTARAKSIAQGITISSKVYSELHRLCVE
ncbi:delta1-piperideine-2-carboxylate reductase [Burkholderia sp. GAS332]|nr:delta1-piperideine-2-carboxylate reductase [Burkholderia sp. GAS332]